MALVSDSTEFSLGISNLLSKAQRAVGHFFSPPDHSPEQALLSGPLRDSRLAPRVPMSGSELDAGLLAQLSSIGLKRGKQVTAESHPELMQAWNAMSQRAGLARPPQLIVAESDSLNALTVNREEVIVTTGFLSTMDLRETVAVLGHELGHVQSDHASPRLFWMGVLGGAGAVAGNEFGRHGGANMLLTKLGARWSIFEKAQNMFYGAARKGAASSVLGTLLYASVGISAGAILASKVSVRPTELDADAKGAAISGDPAGLAAALDVLRQHAPSKSLNHSWKRWKSGYPTMEKRMANLREMAANGNYRPVLDELGSPAEKTSAAQPSAPAPALAVQGVASAGRVAEASELGLA